jgi:hypothetical protein
MSGNYFILIVVLPTYLSDDLRVSPALPCLNGKGGAGRLGLLILGP